MPRLRPREVRWYHSLLLVLVLASYGYLLWRYPLVVGGVTAGIACISYVDNRRRRRRFKALAAERAGDSICTFARAFEKETDTWILRAVYEQIQAELADLCQTFPVRPADRLREDLTLDADDVDFDLVPGIAKRAGRSLRQTKDNPYYGKVETVADLVRFLCAQGKDAA